MNPALYSLVTRAALTDDSLSPRALQLILAVCNGTLGEAHASPGAEPPPTAEALEMAEAAPALFLQTLAVTGFRGIAERVELRLDPGPGLTVIAGRNGSGKSSLSEALETLLFGRSDRWVDKPQEWKTGWANVHHDGTVQIEAAFRVEGESEPLFAIRRWEDRAGKVDASSVLVSSGDEVSKGLAALPGHDLLSVYKPLLSYGALGRLLEQQPSVIFDQIAKVLGLEELTHAKTALTSSKQERAKSILSLQGERKQLLSQLSGVADERARACERALGADPWDLESLNALIQNRDKHAGDRAAWTLLTNLSFPSEDELGSQLTSLQDSIRALREQEATDAGRSAALAALLREALDYHEHVGEESECPVCGSASPLDEKWRTHVGARIKEAEALAPELEEARRRVEEQVDALVDLERLVREQDLSAATDLGLSDAHREAWERWVEGLDSNDPEELVRHVQQCHERARDSVERMKALATAELESRETAWQPIIKPLAAWVRRAEPALAEDWEGTRDALQEAVAWLESAENGLRDQRFEPIADLSQELWQELRQDSNVRLQGISLIAKGKSRRVNLDAVVDDSSESVSALGLMSQGELNALALSLFLPRVLLDDTPFHFVVIDDPVQSMDPHKVDGLAKVLRRVAETRQVIVFTHDARLLAALERLRIPATRYQVTRGVDSSVEVTLARTPTQQYLLDAERILDPVSAEQIGEENLRRIVPGVCRLALESALQTAARRRLLREYGTHQKVGAELKKARATVALAALALFGDARRGDEVPEEIKRQWPNLEEVYSFVNRGAHEPHPGDLKKLVKQTRQFARQIGELE